MNLRNKITEIESLSSIRASNRGSRIALCHGCFDIVHAGHINHFIAAKKDCDLLVVSVTTDEFITKKRPFGMDTGNRILQIAALEIVDYVVAAVDPSALPIIEALHPDCYFKGDEYKKLESDATKNIYHEKDAVEKHGGEIRFTSEKTFSTTKLGYFSGFQTEADQDSNYAFGNLKIRDLSGLKINLAAVKSAIQALSSLEVLIVGEAILDRWERADVIGISPKSGCTTGLCLEVEDQAGGAVTLSRHLASIGVRSTLVVNQIPETLILDPKINVKFVQDSKVILKHRFVNSVNGTTLFQIQDIPHQAFIAPCGDEFNKDEAFDLGLIADYGHELISSDAIQWTKKLSRIQGCFSQINTYSKGQTRLQNLLAMPLIFANLEETKSFLNIRKSDGLFVAEQVQSHIHKGQYFFLTLGEQGCLVISPDEILTYESVFYGDAVDTVGAGDAFMALATVTYVATKNIDLAVFFGSSAAGCVLTDFGTKRCLQPDDLLTIAKVAL